MREINDAAANSPGRRTLPGFVRFLLNFLALVLGLALGLLAFLYVKLGSIHYIPIPNYDASGNLHDSRDTYIPEEYRAVAADDAHALSYRPQKDSSVYSFLIFGTDSRTYEGEDQGRTDSMMVCSLDRRHKQIKLSSLMRDLRVSYEGSEGEGKLNAANVYGGAGELINTINANFDLDIQRYVKVDFSSTREIVDAIGGVSVAIATQEELDAINEVVRDNCNLLGLSYDDYAIQETGETVRLNGVQALAFARMRSVGNDQGRTYHQRQLFMAIVAEIKSMGAFRQLQSVLRLMPMLKTNMSRGEMLSLLIRGYIRSYPIYDYRVPEDGLYDSSEDTGWDLVVEDMAVQRQRLLDFIYGEGEAS